MYRYKHYNTYKNVHKKQEVSERKDHYGEVQKNMIRRQKRTEKVLWARPDIGIPASGILEGGGGSSPTPLLCIHSNNPAVSDSLRAAA